MKQTFLIIFDKPYGFVNTTVKEFCQYIFWYSTTEMLVLAGSKGISETVSYISTNNKYKTHKIWKHIPYSESSVDLPEPENALG